MKTILVSGASGIVGYGILRSLRKVDCYKLIGIAAYNDSVAPAFCDTFELAPMTYEDGYIEWLCATLKKHNVDLAIPSIEIDMFHWREHRELIEKSGSFCLLNNPELVSLCGDKWNFFKRLQERAPEYAIESRLSGSFDELVGAFGLPFLLKPRRGYASRGIVEVGSQNIFGQFSDAFGQDLMAQAIVGTQELEYTTSAFFSKSSELCCHMTLRRKLSKEGFTEKAQVAEVSGMEKALCKLGDIFKPVGPTNFQFREEADGCLKLLEINPRVSSATSIRTAFGYNESVMSVDYFLDGKLPVQPKILRGEAVRYIEDKIFYDRDNF
ncbi:ATP-grasp domain-containing protein [Maridesulfovibrio salexigens]|uniref:Carbamoyl-phosphate synthase L chain, ATP-binding n=1 Tax=Maridesulfovibrio salexigens (strain ATCC 14822 / DSM 2638 / NCIMB 8403 / VKM B-1763) TaxID=526222 RepID=C6BTH0_MARSD|nr:ATP-grasp domain-containing protein [Maridesulfovibrio salexigens]ACS81651.1 carbamoyl-phosphate synthase L chain, ATP-binding [Maridesulfovibrio salexigens DSM 2638]